MGRILVIDDDDQVRSMLCETLEHAGHSVMHAPDGKSALRQFVQNPAEVVITDILMPDIGGIDTIAGIRSNNPDVKIIAISGGGPTADAEMCLDMAKRIGADKTLPKPVRRDELLLAVSELTGAES